MSMVQINNIVIRNKIVLLKILGLISEKNIYIFIDLQIEPNFHQNFGCNFFRNLPVDPKVYMEMKRTQNI